MVSIFRSAMPPLHGAFKKKLIYAFKPMPKPRINGPTSVSHSLMRGLDELGIAYNFNPQFPWQVHKNVIVLQGVEAVEQMVRLKRRGRIKKLIVGPNVYGSPLDGKKQSRSSYIDLFVLPGPWAVEFHNQVLPWAKGKIKVWYAGVDVECWKPAEKQREKILIYNKNVEDAKVAKVLKVLEQKKVPYAVVNYGHYKQEDYLAMLQGAWAAIFFTKVESQGLALLEAWACDVPTMVYEQTEVHDLKTNLTVQTSSAPYLTDAAGLFFQIETFEQKFDEFLANIERMSPRHYVLEKFTDGHIAQKLLNYFDES